MVLTFVIAGVGVAAMLARIVRRLRKSAIDHSVAERRESIIARTYHGLIAAKQFQIAARNRQREAEWAKIFQEHELRQAIKAEAMREWASERHHRVSSPRQ